MTMTIVQLVKPGEHCPELGWCVCCDASPATTLVVDDRESPILGDLDGADGAEFGVCSRCAELAYPNLPRVCPVPRVPVYDRLPTNDGT